MKLSKNNYKKARDFILTNARMIERRLFQFHFENDDPEGVFHAVYAYRNSDGGFGHGMEPDTSSPESQPLFSIMALETLDEASLLTKTRILNDFMPYFESITTDKGGIPWMFRPLGDYPCEDHFKTVKEWAALSTTAPLLGILEKHNIEIPWMEKAEEFVWQEIERIKEKHIFCHLCVPRRLQFLSHTKSKNKAEKALKDLKKWILTEGVLCNDKSDGGWGLYGKPHSLCYAPAPESILNPIFSQEMIDSDLDELIKRQKEDGRWDTWYGLSEGMKLEWAGIQTLWTLKTLKNYKRIED
ncbi:hypothetical protein [Lutimonas zeaxanthinifaciens]|uniref:hypothetical protein n=1 Tax=Lutimonas zeaxanthinifaciens TaxID=3060215 RepID=UPI00265D2543|nr:hypothetical protein [Lutimonas sp. YSD2104]WKK67093.1 hypothetical protein QZH61_05580 [Lutimonas sp. YSD2104]